jgi:hypothetical protein
MNCCYCRGRRVEVGVWVKRSVRTAAGVASSQNQVHQSLCPPKLLGFERNVLLVKEAAANPRHRRPRVLPVSNLRSQDSSIQRNDQTAPFSDAVMRMPIRTFCSPAQTTRGRAIERFRYVCFLQRV